MFEIYKKINYYAVFNLYEIIMIIIINYDLIIFQDNEDIRRSNKYDFTVGESVPKQTVQNTWKLELSMAEIYGMNVT